MSSIFNFLKSSDGFKKEYDMESKGASQHQRFLKTGRSSISATVNNHASAVSCAAAACATGVAAAAADGARAAHACAQGSKYRGVLRAKSNLGLCWCGGGVGEGVEHMHERSLVE